MSVVDLLNYLRTIKNGKSRKDLRNKLYCDIQAFQKEEAKALEPL